ncbi:MAG: YgiT-type zinc finger protein [Methanothrix sp.]|nr:YgiT-type zinc finger protein [Methanothrix sp.]MDD4579873.1 YgiT-type zinc finger protein [Methanothrix sp.]
MIPDTCSFCKGKLREGKKEFVVKVKNEVVVIRDVPALVCDCCDEAYITPEISEKIDEVMEEFYAGRLLAKPLAAGEVMLKA